MYKYCNALDLANDHGHSQIAEFLLTKGAKVENCNKVSNALIICDCPSENQHSLHLRFWSFNGS